MHMFLVQQSFFNHISDNFSDISSETAFEHVNLYPCQTLQNQERTGLLYSHQVPQCHASWNIPTINFKSAQETQM